MKTNDITFFGKAAYFHDLAERISQTTSGDSVVLATMNFDSEYAEVREVVDALCAAAKRGAHVRLLVDAYNFLSSKNKLIGPMWFSGKLPEHMTPYYQKKLGTLEQLRACGGHYTITNMPNKSYGNPFGGRSHIKFAVINDYVYTGGCNLNAVDNIDLMVGWSDSATAAWLQKFAADIDKRQSVRRALKDIDEIRHLDDRTKLIIDAGVPDQSAIYTNALELIDEAEKSVYITCQYFPNSETTRHLVKAHDRGVDVTVIFNHPWQHGSHYPLQQAVVWRERMRTPTTLFNHQLPTSQKFLHAKLLATEKAAIVGSHNFVPTGVKLGTAEIALLRRDPNFAQAAIQTIKNQIV